MATAEISPNILISPKDLDRAINEIDKGPTRIIPVASGRAAERSSFERRQIPGSIFFNLDEINDTESPYPLMLPEYKAFQQSMARLGVCPADTLVFYDTFEAGIYFAPRAAWTCAHFGYNNIYILNSFRGYVDNGYPTCSGEFSQPENSIIADSQGGAPVQAHLAAKIDFDQLHERIQRDYSNLQIIDARSPELFSGRICGGGHMPGAVNVPFTSLLDNSQRTILEPKELRMVLERAGVKENKAAVLTCNSGVTAAFIWVAFQVLGLKARTELYDGSWSEWRDRAGADFLLKC